MIGAGLRISEYILEERLGAGAFGEVWRARHHIWGDQIAAIKIPHDMQYIRDLQREGVVVQGLDHPNIVKAIGFDPYASPPYLAMEYIQGKSLRQMIAGKLIKIDDAQRIMLQLLSGLEYAHGRGLIHRDLKPENVMIVCDPNGAIISHDVIAKITDFGFGQRCRNAPGSIAYSMSLQGDQALKIVGTLDYMSPEQKSGDVVDARSDLYACGVMLFEMLTGEKPGGTEVPGDLVPGIPNYLNEAFRRAYARLDRRFESASEMRLAIVPPLPVKTVAKKTSPDHPVQGEIHCPRCQRTVGSKDQFCMYCGVQLVKLIARCTRCGAYPDADDQFCTQCGQTLVRMRIAT